MDNLKTYLFAAVLTGDLVRSRRFDDATQDAALAALRKAAQDMGSDVVFARHRGDGWQVFLPDARLALRAAMRLLAALAASDTGMSTRMAIGLGEARLPADADLAAAQGAAFQSAGTLLDALPRPDRLALPQGSDAASEALAAMAMLLDWEARRWSPGQAAALYEALRPDSPTHEDIGAKFGVSRQAIQMRLAATGLRAIRQALTVFESRVDAVWPTPKAA